MKKVGLLIGRFQPLHKGHIKLIKDGLKKYDKVIILVGTKEFRDFKNPFDFKFVNELITINFKKEIFNDNKLYVSPVEDKIFDADWLDTIKHILNFTFDVMNLCKENTNFYLMGTNKDRSTYYLKDVENYLTKEKFNIINATSTTTVENNICATDIRNMAYKYGGCIGINNYLGYSYPPLLEKFNELNEAYIAFKYIKIAFDYHGILNKPKTLDLYMYLKSLGCSVCILTGQYEDKIKEEFDRDNLSMLKSEQIISVLDYCKLSGIKTTINPKNGQDWIYDLDLWNSLKATLCIKNDINILVDDTIDYTKFANPSNLKVIIPRENLDFEKETILNKLFALTY